MSSLPSGHFSWLECARPMRPAQYMICIDGNLLFTDFAAEESHYPVNSLKCNIFHLLPFGIAFRPGTLLLILMFQGIEASQCPYHKMVFFK